MDVYSQWEEPAGGYSWSIHQDQLEGGGHTITFTHTALTHDCCHLKIEVGMLSFFSEEISSTVSRSQTDQLGVLAVVQDWG